MRLPIRRNFSTLRNLGARKRWLGCPQQKRTGHANVLQRLGTDDAGLECSDVCSNIRQLRHRITACMCAPFFFFSMCEGLLSPTCRGNLATRPLTRALGVRSTENPLRSGDSVGKNHAHITAPVGIVLFQLGGPDTLEAIEPFLYNLFCDPDIIDFPFARIGRKPLAKLISTTRARKVQHHYATIGGGSQIRRHTERQARVLESELHKTRTRCTLLRRHAVLAPVYPRGN